MKYLLTQLFLLVFSVIILYYFSTLSDFLPYTLGGEIDWYTVSVVFILIFIFFESVIATIIFLAQKFLAFGWKEFPDKRFSLKMAVGLGLGLVFILFLHINHLLSFIWGVLLLVVITAIILIL